MDSVANKWADYWRNKIGVNVIPNDSVNKKPRVAWTQWHSEPVPADVHEKWKADGMFEQGMAVCVGRAWHLNNENNGNNKLYLVAIDCDNAAAVAFARGNLPIDAMMQETRGVAEKLHLYVYLRDQIENYAPASDAPVRIEMHAQKHLITCTPSQYGQKQPDGTCMPTGKYYRLVTAKPQVVDTQRLVMPAQEIRKKRRASEGLPFDVIPEGNRNRGFFDVCHSFMKKFRVSEKFDNDLAWLYLWNYNLKYCKPPLDELEARHTFESSLSYKEPDDVCSMCNESHSPKSPCPL